MLLGESLSGENIRTFGKYIGLKFEYGYVDQFFEKVYKSCILAHFKLHPLLCSEYQNNVTAYKKAKRISSINKRTYFFMSNIE
jgi:hypothetical protein